MPRHTIVFSEEVTYDITIDVPEDVDPKTFYAEDGEWFDTVNEAEESYLQRVVGVENRRIVSVRDDDAQASVEVR